MDDNRLKSLVFLGSSRKDLKDFPKPVRDDIGFDLYQVQQGKTLVSAKPFKGLHGVMEIIERYDKDTYRAMYVAKFGDTVYVLHCFKKKSKQGIKTPKLDININSQRYKDARKLAE